MAILDELKKLKLERKDVIDGAQAITVKAAAEKRSLTPEDRQEIDKRMDQAKELQGDIDRLTLVNEQSRSLEQPAPDNRVAGRQDVGTVEDRTEQTKVEVRKGFSTWARTGQYDSLTAEARSAVEAELRALSTESGVAGGYTVPANLVPKLEVALKWFGGIVEACSFLNTAQGGPLAWPSMNDTINSGRFQGENTAARDDSTTPKAAIPAFGAINFNAYMFDSDVILMPVQLLQDSAVDIESEIVTAAGIRIGRSLNTLCTTGTGNAQPNGLLNATKGIGATSGSATALTYNDVQALRFSVDKAYRGPASSYMMHDQVLKVLAQLVDSNGRPLFLAGGITADISKKNPDTLAGYNIVINNDLPSTLTANTQTMLFGDFSKYRVRRVGSMAFVRFQERYMNNLQWGFMAYQRFDGNLIDGGTHPVACLTQHA